MADEKITDEMLKQRWMEWGCEEELLDRILQRLNNMDIPNIFIGLYENTYNDKRKFQYTIDGWKEFFEDLDNE